MTTATKIAYSDLRTKVAADEVDEITWSNDGGSITGKLEDGTEFSSNGPNEPPEDDLALFREHDVEVKFSNPQPSIFEALLPLLIPVALLIGFFWLDAAPGPGPDGRDHVHRPQSRPRRTPPSSRARRSPTSPATRASSRRSPRSSTS